MLDTKRIYEDPSLSYNIDTQDLSVILGLDYKPTKNWFIGVEAGLSGKKLKLRKDYIGLRTGLRYNF